MAKHQGDTPLAGSERPRPATHRLVGPVDPGEVIGITLVIRARPGSPPLPDLAHWQATPPGKRHFLSPDEFTQKHGAAQSDLDAVATFAAKHGLTVVESHAGRRSVCLKGSAAQLDAAFGITLHSYEAPLPGAAPRTSSVAASAAIGTHTHHGYDGPVHLPPELAGVVVSVVGLDNRCLGGPVGDPAGATSLFVPSVAQFYNFPNPTSGVPDQTIGVISPSDTPTTSSRRFGGYLKSDITQYFKNLAGTGYATAPVMNDVNLTVGTNPYSNSLANSTATSITSSNLSSNANSFILEVTQDILTSSTVAQGATVNVYFTENSEQGWLVFLNRLLVPGSEKQPTVVTCSFNVYLGDDLAPSSAITVMTGLFQALAARGINVFIAQGDWGADNWWSLTASPPTAPDGKSHVGYPNCDPWVTSCGGTIVASNPSGSPPFLENVWSDSWSTSPFGSQNSAGTPNSNFGSTGGGVAKTFSAPAYQTAAGITGATDSSNKVQAGRGVPDVAGMVSLTGFLANNVSYNFTGTSCVAPLYAGLTAVLRSSFGVELGFLNPTLYQLRNSAFNDVTTGNNDSNDTPTNVKIAIPGYTGTTADAPYFTAGTGWDACTGLGSIDGTKLLNGIASLMYTMNFYFQAEKTTYGLDEVRINEAPASTGNSTYSGVFWLVLENFTPAAAAEFTLTPNSGLPGVTFTIGAGTGEMGSLTNTPQRVLYPCTITFANNTINTVSQGGVFPALNGTPIELTLTAVARSSTQLFEATVEFQLVGGADPNFANFTSVNPTNPQEENVFYLSQDLRVFTVTPGANFLPAIPGVTWPGTNFTTFDTATAYSYIQNLITTLTNNSTYNAPGGTDPFTLLTDQSNALTGDSSVTPSTLNPGSATSSDPTGTTWANYNFAIARVRLTDVPGPTTSNVRVFFRLFAAETNDTDYQPGTTYSFNADSTGLPQSPTLGLVGTDVVTIPFFATGNYDSSSTADYGVNNDYPASGTTVNSKPITVPSGGTAWAYYGCYLNIYPTTNTINVNGQVKTVQSLLPSSHSCVVAQIAFDEAPIPTGSITASPANTDKLAQRNLQITFSDNPGPPATHRIPQTFDTRPSPAISTTPGNLLNYPDELMIEWGNTPVGSTANIYWPQVNAAEVLALAKQIYATHQLSAADLHTIQCKVPSGFTFVPIPTGSGKNFAGLFTVDLPPGVRTGQLFNIIVRRITTRRVQSPPPPPPPIQIQVQTAAVPAVREKVMHNWRNVVGTFSINIPVTTSSVMLPVEESTYSILTWRLGQMLPTNRWYPVLLRYLCYLAGCIDGLGGCSSSITPSPIGVPIPLPPRSPFPIPQPKPGKHHEYTGKVNGLVYDRFGDFEGFLLLTEHGEEHRFYSRESEIEALVRFAWQNRVVITVLTEHHDKHHPISIILRRAPSEPLCLT
jgi:subtilase family serine protease